MMSDRSVFDDYQWVMPGMIFSSTSAIMESQSAPTEGASFATSFLK
jgi:hypothetical protein